MTGPGAAAGPLARDGAPRPRLLLPLCVAIAILGGGVSPAAVTRLVPEEKIIREKNPDPTGRDAHFCYNEYTRTPLCFVPPSGTL